MNARMKRLLMTVAVGAVAISGSYALAGTISDSLFSLGVSPRAEGMGGASVAICFDPTATITNPAGLAMVPDWQASVLIGSQPSGSIRLIGSPINPVRRTSGDSSSIGLNFAGFALPASNFFSRTGGGAIGISYARIGSYKETTTSSFNDSSYTYDRKLSIETDFITLGYGVKMGGKNKLNFGIGAVYALQNYDDFIMEVNPGGGGIELGPISDTGTGVGVIVGVHQPGPTFSWGASYRSDISLSGQGDFSDYADKVPGRANFGVAYLIQRRGDPASGKGSELIGAADVEHIFEANKDKFWERDATTDFRLGFEYALYRRDMIIPIRFGYRSIKSGMVALPGEPVTFGDTDLLTLGVGYRPNNESFSLDITLGFTPSGTSTSLGMTYRFGE